MLKLARLSAFIFVAIALSLPAPAQTSNWTIEPNHSTVQFTVRHMAISNVTGYFRKLTGSVVLNDADITQSQVSASIDVSSVDTRVAPRDASRSSPPIGGSI